MCFQACKEDRKAIEDFSAIIAMDSTNGSAYYHRGVCLVELGMHEEAIWSFTEAIQQNEGDSKALNYRAHAYIQRGLLGEAVSDWTMALELDPYDNVAHHNRNRIIEMARRQAQGQAQGIPSIPPIPPISPPVSVDTNSMHSNSMSALSSQSPIQHPTQHPIHTDRERPLSTHTHSQLNGQMNWNKHTHLSLDTIDGEIVKPVYPENIVTIMEKSSYSYSCLSDNI
jgi:tetratricopeptide (TPR) repeat protein